MSDHVTIQFKPAREFRQVKKSYWINTDGDENLQLPVAETELITEKTPDGVMATGATIPRFIAEDRGLIEAPVGEMIPEDESFSMTRYDWFMLGVTMAMIIRGDSVSDVVWEAGKIVYKLEEMRE